MGLALLHTRGNPSPLRCFRVVVKCVIHLLFCRTVLLYSTIFAIYVLYYKGQHTVRLFASVCKHINISTRRRAMF